ncbi:response regulator [Luteolibacter pohnpeiensis]|uniref:histidine kinase n=1 Tax=Luteolibacter pohnpeiensis TaxID=454153 RepID=A0A934S837_9BACT|nr:response regulator [Luteolibacter pohnpeiensis]MBK1883907.1 response regulator [Luteolibacter pohnpeiensis]
MTPGSSSSGDLSGFSMTELFRIDADNQLTTLSEGLLALGSGVDASSVLEELMRAAHSIKGAARIVNVDAAVGIAHVMEDVFVSAQKNPGARFPQSRIDLMLKGTDLLRSVIFDTEPKPTAAEIAEFVRKCGLPADAEESSAPAPTPKPEPAKQELAAQEPQAAEASRSETQTRSVRIGSDNLDRLVSLAGENRITLNRANRFNKEAEEIATVQRSLLISLRGFAETFAGSPQAAEHLEDIRRKIAAAEDLAEQLRLGLDEYSFQISQLGNRLYTEALSCRMRPFADCVLSLKRLVRDLSRSLGKPCRLEVRGENTEVDRDILERLESTLTHLIRNALDHGIEPSHIRDAVGKDPQATITISAAHVSGRLVIRLSDDGRGIDPEYIRKEIVARGLISRVAASTLTFAEVMEFLFLPGFSMSNKVTEISGRGVGLDAVRSTAKALRGTIRVHSTLGAGTTFELSTPISQALARCLLVDIAGTPCALPLARIEGVANIPEEETHYTEGRQHCDWNGQRIGLINAAQVLEFEENQPLTSPLSVVIMSEAGKQFGVVVANFLGEEELLLQPLDSELGKIRDLAATSLMADGSPVLVLDDEDFLLSIRTLAGEGRLRVSKTDKHEDSDVAKHVLVVDDSLTVRELERKLLTERGYEVTTAVDGMDGLSTLREGKFDMVITDVDMPRMDGIELVEKIRANPHFRDLPVMIVSYKDRQEDRERGLEAGADYYLAKSSFHSDELARMVEQFIGPAYQS